MNIKKLYFCRKFTKFSPTSNMKNGQIKNQNGVALIITILLLSLILFLSLYLLTFSLTEDRIARSQAWGAKTYYLAEAGIQDMVFKLKNDATYKSSFETNPTWTQSFSRTDPFGAGNGSYTVTIVNSSLAHGQITAIGTIDIGGGKESQRIIKTFVYRAMGQSGIGNNATYADGDINISASRLNFYNGNVHSNLNFIVNLISTVNIEDDLHAVGNFTKSSWSTVNVGGVIMAHNYPPEPAPIDMPAVDFDSADPDSLKNRASVVYTSTQFKNMLEATPNLVLNNPITYVTGDIDLKCNQKLTVNGLLISDRDINIGNLSIKCLLQCGQNDVTVNHTVGQPAGLFAKRKINFDICTGNANINGVVYANDELRTLSLPQSFYIIGGMISRKLTTTSVWQPINITFNSDYLTEALGATEFSPVITVEHWEEEY